MRREAHIDALLKGVRRGHRPKPFQPVETVRTHPVEQIRHLTCLVQSSVPQTATPLFTRVNTTMTSAHSGYDQTAWGADPWVSSWNCLTSVKSFADCSPDQYIRVMPRLLPRDGTVPPTIRDHLAKCVASLVAPSKRLDQARGGAMSRRLANAVVGLALRVRRQHDAGRLAHKADPLDPARHDPDSKVAERASAILSPSILDGLLREIDKGTLRRFDTEVAALFTFSTGIHAVYLWPEALLSHEFFTAVGWLGHVRRGRRATMPKDLAEYFVDVLVRSVLDTVTVRDRLLSPFLDDPGLVEEVWCAAQCVLRSGPVVVKWPRVGDRRIAAEALCRQESARRHESAYP